MDTKWVTPIGDEGLYENKYRQMENLPASDRLHKMYFLRPFVLSFALCPLFIDNNKIPLSLCFDLNYCKGCGICAKECPVRP